jgi:hypothetical protein
VVGVGEVARRAVLAHCGGRSPLTAMGGARVAEGSSSRGPLSMPQTRLSLQRERAPVVRRVGVREAVDVPPHRNGCHTPITASTASTASTARAAKLRSEFTAVKASRLWR